MIGPVSSWFEVVEPPVVEYATTDMRARNNTKEKNAYFNKSSTMISTLVDKTWFSRCPCCQHINGIKGKPTSVKNPQANAIQQVHQVLMMMICTDDLDMTNSVAPSNVDEFLSNAAWAICSTYHTVLKASPSAAIFGRDMLFNIDLPS